MTCGECRYINGVFLSMGFCDKFFRDVRTDRAACSAFAKPQVAKRAYVAPETKIQTPTSEPQQKEIVMPKRRRSHTLISKLTHEEKLTLITDYRTVPISELAKRYGVSHKCLLRTLSKLGVTLRKRGQVTKTGKEKQMAGVKGYFANRRDDERTHN